MQAALLAGLAALFIAFPAQPVVLLVVAFLLFVPGWIARRLLSDLLRGRALMARRDFAGGLASTQRFLESCHQRPWIRHAIWGAYGVYTLDVVAMGLNNAGAALTELGRLDEAEAFLEEARRQDPNYPMPVFNLARIAKLRGNDEQVTALAEEARKLGMPGSRLDRLLLCVGEGYARLPR